ncbi:MAG TPA: CHASE3 domain-containing protein [Xanthobacteraceae bacterium]|nr:CHASE3 domain-containing protein [Xanthobacteraceae bacterium]
MPMKTGSLIDIGQVGKSRSLVPHARTILATAFGLVLIAGVAAVYIAVRAADADLLVAHTFEVRQQALRLFSDLQDAETGQRGYLLTTDAKYLEPFRRADDSIASRIATLRQLISDNPEQREWLSNVKSLIDEKLDELRRTIVLLQQGQREAAIDIIKSDRGKELMDGIRSQVDAFTQHELDLLVARQDVAALLRRWLLALVCFSLLAAVSLAGILARAIERATNVARQRTVELEAEATLRHETEDTLRQGQKIEAVGQLTGGIAHDFNNLLTIILGNLDTLHRRLADFALTQDGKQLAALLLKPLDVASQGARSAAQLTHRLLAFSRRQPLEPAQVDLNRLISGMSDLLRRTLGETISVETVMAGGLWPTFADANQVENALINLCVNARDAMPNGGRLTIETGNAYLDEAYTRQFGDVTPGQYAMLSVADSGTGIPAEVLDRIFEPFFTTKALGEGSGLGLAMVHGFVKQSSGHIRIYSEVGHGTTVKIYLPRLMRPEQTAAAPAAKSAAGASIPRAEPEETILLVEDNEGVREYATSALEDLGYNVLVTADAIDALRLLDGAPRVDLLFTDVILPGASGRELADKVLGRCPGLPVLFTTGYTRNAIIHQGRLDAGVQLISKPYTQQSLGRKIRELLDAKPLLSRRASHERSEI